MWHGKSYRAIFMSKMPQEVIPLCILYLFLVNMQKVMELNEE